MCVSVLPIIVVYAPCLDYFSRYALVHNTGRDCVLKRLATGRELILTVVQNPRVLKMGLHWYTPVESKTYRFDKHETFIYAP